VTLIGNIPAQALHRGTKADVERETMPCVETSCASSSPDPT
jgi:hypothetical protein